MSGKLYFAGDFHLGAPTPEQSLDREKHVVSWLDTISQDAEAIYLMGDVFDYWFEYQRAVPRGHVRLLGKLAEITDKGIPVHWFTGNHDMWIFNYIPAETGVQIHRGPISFSHSGKSFYLAHGDGLGPGDRGYKMLKKVLSNKVCQWLFARLHPNFGIWLMRSSSNTSRNAAYNGRTYMGEDKEWLIIHSKEILQKEHVDFFIYGHRHLVLDIPIGPNSRYINTGDWITQFHYAEFQDGKLDLKPWQPALSGTPRTDE
jgi:UDP-2,3-diacylglucosamine hydrolase